MIKTNLELKDITPLATILGPRFHQESKFNHLEYNQDKVVNLLLASLSHPDRVFVAYDDKFRGILILQVSSYFFSDAKWVGDQAFYVVPEARGTRVAIDLLRAGQAWSKDVGAEELVILHNAGIGLESAKKFYTHCGFDLTGLIFNKQVT